MQSHHADRHFIKPSDEHHHVGVGFDDLVLNITDGSFSPAGGDGVEDGFFIFFDDAFHVFAGDDAFEFEINHDRKPFVR